MTAFDDERSVSSARETSSGSPETAPVVFGTDDSLFGLLTVPQVNSPRNVGAVICAPLGLENVFSYRPLRTLGRHLADRGIPVLRFDWLGCGDSGEPRTGDAGLRAWRDAVDDAVDKLINATGVATVALIGLRIGATFGLLEATTNPAVTEVVLLEPYTTGRAYLRELRAFERVAEQTILLQPPQGSPPLPEGSMEAGGFLLSAAEVQAIDSIDLEEGARWTNVPRRSLVVSTQSDRSTTALVGLLAEAGSQVTSHVEPKLSSMWAIPAWSFLPPNCARLVVDWMLEDGAQERRRHQQRRPDVPIAGAFATLALAEGTVHEQAALIETDLGRIFAVTCVPAGIEGGDEWVVFLNAGPVRRIGPNRLSTVWARKWARAGLPSLRLDLYGLGESDGDPGRDEAFLNDPLLAHHPERLREIRAAFDWLAERHGARRFTVIGLCSGATQAFQVGLSDPRVAGVGMINPGALFVDQDLLHLSAWDELRRVLRQPHALLFYVRNHGARWALKGMLKGVRGRVRSVSGQSGWASYQPVVTDSLARLRAANTKVAAIFSDGEDGIGWFEQILGPDSRAQLEGMGMTIEIVEGPDHTFRPLWSHDVLESFFERLLTSTGFLNLATIGHAQEPDVRSA